MFVHQSLNIDKNLKALLAGIGLSGLQDFMDYSAGQLVSRPSKRHIRTLYLDVAGEKRKYFLKQSGLQSLPVVLKTLCHTLL